MIAAVAIFGAESGDALGLLLLAVVTAIASGVNSVAGGGTILTFPMLAAILPESPSRMVVANATSTIGLWPGAMAAAWAYRSDRIDQPAWARRLIPPSVVGAVIGTALVLVLPPQWFATLVPWLILLAAVLFTIQPRLASLAPREPGVAPHASIWLACLLQCLVAVYGGYFGAGIGILMLAVLAMLGLGDIHRLNAVKNVLGMVVNGTAAAVFAVGSLAGTHDVAWRHAGVMAVAAVIGGLGGAHLARRMPAPVVRRMVAVIGFVLAGYYFLK